MGDGQLPPAVPPALAGLDDPVRRRMYDYVCGCIEPAGRDEVAAATGYGRPLVAYHLDKLVELGLLTASYRRPAGRGGPGAGRPAKVYARSGREFCVSVPPREYELAARLLTDAVASEPTGAAMAELDRSARCAGTDLARSVLAHSASQDAGTPASANTGTSSTGACGSRDARLAGTSDPATSVPSADVPSAGGPATSASAVRTVLAAHGFEPWQDECGTLRLRNCPFRQLAARYPRVACAMNLALLQGVLAGAGATGLRATLDPAEGRCCVAIAASPKPCPQPDQPDGPSHQDPQGAE